MKPANARKPKVNDKPADSPAVSSPFSAKLLAELTAHKTAALRIELAKQPAVAVAALTHAMLLNIWHGYGPSRENCLEISANSKLLSFSAPTPADEAFESIGQSWHAKLPNETDGLWQWCLAQHLDTLLELLAYLTAATIDAVQEKTDCGDAPYLRHAEHLAQVLKLDMRTWFAPTAEGLFNHVSRKSILAIIEEAKGPQGPALEKLGKKDLAQRAEQLLAGTKWLPLPLRSGSDPLADCTTEEAA